MNLLPNILTIFRMVIAPIMFICVISQSPKLVKIGFFTFILGAISDFLDGYLARRMVLSRFGKLWDPIADKILTGLAMIALVITNYLPIWAAFALILRDIVVTCIRIRVLLKSGEVVLPMFFAKLKTTFEIILITVLMALFAFSGSQLPSWGKVSVILYSVGLIVLSWATGIKYIILAHHRR